MKRAAIGFRTHSGWAVAVAVSGSPRDPVVLELVLDRRRIVICDDTVPGSKQPYHAAVPLEPEAAEEWIRDCRDRSTRLATAAIRGLAGELLERGYRIAGTAILAGSGRVLPDLPAILRAHPLLHTAEGEFYREVLVRASETCSLKSRRVKERDAWETAAPGFGLNAAELEQRIGELGKTLGPPWRQDEKLAAIAAWIALAE